MHVPALPEIVTEGDTEAEALAMAKDAIELVVESRARARWTHLKSTSRLGQAIAQTQHLLAGGNRICVGSSLMLDPTYAHHSVSSVCETHCRAARERPYERGTGRIWPTRHQSRDIRRQAMKTSYPPWLRCPSTQASPQSPPPPSPTAGARRARRRFRAPARTSKHAAFGRKKARRRLLGAVLRFGEAGVGESKRTRRRRVRALMH